ncbi:MAG: hypothetical protein ACJA2W_001746 [Planctomycetota bacterium]|jgi:hypothetical protein
MAQLGPLAVKYAHFDVFFAQDTRDFLDEDRRTVSSGGAAKGDSSVFVDARKDA